MGKIIAFSGFIKTGKSTCRDLIQELRPNFKAISFADPLKEMFAKHKNIPVEYLYDINTKERYREELVEYSDFIRSKDQYIFANKLIKSLKKRENYVIDDLRSLFELEVLIKAKARPFRVLAPHHIRKQRGWIPNPTVDSHITETEMDLSAETYKSLGGGILYNSDNSMDNLRRTIFNFLIGFN